VTQRKMFDGIQIFVNMNKQGYKCTNKVCENKVLNVLNDQYYALFRVFILDAIQMPK